MRGAAEAQPVATVAEPKRDAAKELSKEAPVKANQPAEAAGTAAAPPPAAKVAVAEEPPPPKQIDKLKKDDSGEQAAASRERAKQQEEVAKNEARKEETVTITSGSVTRRNIGVQTARSSAPSAAGAVQDLKRAPESKSRARDQAKDEDEAAETRSVAGRRFRRSGGVWIDTEYDQSKPTTNVARGSEHYRGLVGDEPSLGKIAQELSGEIIVVWKGRAYRIR
jgi:hypothetical protein